MGATVLDFLRENFIYIVAFLLPMAGAVIAVWRYTEGDHDDAGWVLGASLLGAGAYAVLLTG